MLTHSSSLGGLCLEQQSPAISELAWEPTDEVPTAANCSFVPLERDPHDIAFLQYTSGSTSEPRGVMVTHGNVLHNLAAIRGGFALADEAHQHGVFWLPAYHDMGLIGSILSPLFVGGTSTLLAPTTFLRRPQRWLELLSETRASISGAPNFGYELATRKTSDADRALLDLSNWRLAFCGAEPINPATLNEFADRFASVGFHRGAFFPCYGLAESTVLVTGGQHAEGPRVSACGSDGHAESRGRLPRRAKRHDARAGGLRPPLSGTRLPDCRSGQPTTVRRGSRRRDLGPRGFGRMGLLESGVHQRRNLPRPPAGGSRPRAVSPHGRLGFLARG